MIVDLIVSFVLGLFEAMFSIIPEMEFQDETGMAAPWYSYLGTANRIIPMLDLAAMIGIAVVFALALSVWHMVVWVYEHIPFKAT